MSHAHDDQLSRDLQWLRHLGERIRRERKALRVPVVAAAQAAGISRVTWHRMESGAPGVAAGSYARALEVLGLTAEMTPQASDPPATSVTAQASIPTRIRVADYPQLRQLAWNLRPTTLLTPREALAMYDRLDRYVDREALTDEERQLIDSLREALSDDAERVNS